MGLSFFGAGATVSSSALVASANNISLRIFSSLDVVIIT